jgi:hypothetical protein
MCGVTRQVGLADNLTSVIDVEGEVARYASKVTQVDRRTVLPDHGVNIASHATGEADRLFVVIDRRRSPVSVPGERREFPNLAILPNDGLNLQEKRGARI